MTGFLKARLRHLPGYDALRFLYHNVRTAQGRSIVRLRLAGPAGLFQPDATTFENRYPRVFRFVRDSIGDGPDRRLLSFGCSTGEEVFSLRSYFPQAAIRGIDINPYNIRRCRRRVGRGGGDPHLSFACAGSVAGEEAGSYDAVFAMSVFRHYGLDDGMPRCDHRIRFADFDRAVGELARAVRPGGLFAIRNANFRFSDTAAAVGFKPVLLLGGPSGAAGRRSLPVFGPDNLSMPFSARDDGVYRKRPADSPQTSG